MLLSQNHEYPEGQRDHEWKVDSRDPDEGRVRARKVAMMHTCVLPFLTLTICLPADLSLVCDNLLNKTSPSQLLSRLVLCTIWCEHHFCLLPPR